MLAESFWDSQAAELVALRVYPLHNVDRGEVLFDQRGYVNPSLSGWAISLPKFRFDRVFWKHTSRRVLWHALLTALVVFVTSLGVSIQSTADITWLALVSAALSGLAAFIQTVLEHHKKDEHPTNPKG